MKKSTLFTFLITFYLYLSNAYSSANQHSNCKYVTGTISWGDNRFSHYLVLKDDNNKAIFLHTAYVDSIAGQNDENISNCQFTDRCFSKYESSTCNPSGHTLSSAYGSNFSGLLPNGNKVTTFVNRERNEETGEEPFIEFAINLNSINDVSGIRDVNRYIRKYAIGDNYDKSFAKLVYDFFDNHPGFSNFVKKHLGLALYDFAEDAKDMFNEEETYYNDFY